MKAVCKSTTWLAAVLCTLAAGSASAQKAKEQVSAPIQLTAAQMRAAARENPVGGSAAAVMSFAAPAIDRSSGNVGAPALKLSDRMELANRQMAGDAAAAAGAAASNIFNSAAAPLLDAMQSPNPNVIVGGQTWLRVTDTRAAPYKSVCYVETTWPNGSVTIGTASFAHPRILLSNAHIVWSRARGGWAKWIRVVPGKNGSSEPFGSQYSTYYEVPREWTTGSEGNRDFDISWIVLPNRTLFNRVGYAFGYKTMTNASLTTIDLNMSGYPGSKAGQQWREFVTTNQVVFTNQYRHFFDTVGGSSGSPMYQLTGGLRYVVGVNCAEVTSSPVYNIATRMTSRYFDTTQRLNRTYP